MKNKKNLIAFVALVFLTLFAEGQITSRPTKKVQHPSARSDGLMRIDADGNYLYKAASPDKHQSSHIRIGDAGSPDITVKIEDSTVSFEDLYGDASKIGLGYDYEYFFTQNNGKLGAQAGITVQYAQGNGRLRSNPSQSSVEKFSFFTIPLFLGAVYRFEYADRQLFAPYLAGGGTYVALIEKREDRSKVNSIGAPGFYVSGGVLFNITALDRDMASNFLNEYDIGNLWINLEFKAVQVTSDDFNYENRFIQGGISFDF